MFVVITGVSRGLGRALAEELIARGHSIAGCARGREAVAELACRFPSPHLWHAVDVTQPDQVDHWAKQVLAQAGPPNLLVNNAGVINRGAPLWELTSEEFNQVIDVNIKGVFHVLRAFLPAMVSRRQGVIVNLSSGWGRSTSPEVAPYCATKYAIEGLTHALAQELPPGMAAVPLNPGVIDTSMLRACFGDSAASYPKPERWAKAAATFLLSLNSRHNGQSLTVPGIPAD